MQQHDPFDKLASRIERLLVRYAELQRTNELLQQQVTALTQERDAMRQRLSAARGRVDALLQRLPSSGAGAGNAPQRKGS